MIRGLGTDVVEIARVAVAFTAHGDKLAQRVLSPQEFAAFGQYAPQRQIEFLAGRFAAKEAIAKAIGCGLAQLRMREVDVYVGTHGLSVRGPHFVERWLDVTDEIHLSISHSTHDAFAVAIWESACQGCT